VRVVGRKRIEIPPDAIECTTLHDLANALGMKKNTVYKRFNEGCFHKHTNDIKFTLTDKNKVAWEKYCLSMLHDTNDISTRSGFIELGEIRNTTWRTTSEGYAGRLKVKISLRR
jgi:hypothetical protein